MQRIPSETWQQIQTAYASGIGLREIARNMNIPAGTVLARAKRERWTAQIKNAKALTVTPLESPTVTPTQAVAISMQQRGERHVSRMAGIVERGTGHVEAMDGSGILDRIDEVEKLDKVARRTFGITDESACGINALININILDA